MNLVEESAKCACNVTQFELLLYGGDGRGRARASALFEKRPEFNARYICLDVRGGKRFNGPEYK